MTLATPTEAAALQSPSVAKWQKKLMPWILAIVTFVLLFFLVTTVIQVFYLQQRIQAAPDVSVTFRETDSQTPAQELWRSLLTLEQQSIQQRFHLAQVILMSRLWTIYLGFLTGMILALVGAAFILGKLRGTMSELSGKAGGGELTFKSASPGLIMTVLGTALMITTILTPQKISVKEGPLYVGSMQLQREAMFSGVLGRPASEDRPRDEELDNAAKELIDQLCQEEAEPSDEDAQTDYWRVN